MSAVMRDFKNIAIIQKLDSISSNIYKNFCMNLLRIRPFEVKVLREKIGYHASVKLDDSCCDDLSHVK